MPNGSRHVPCARAMASRKSAAVSSSQCTEGLLCAEGCNAAGEDAGDCAHTIEAQSAWMESSSDLYKCPPAMGLNRLYTLRRLRRLGKAVPQSFEPPSTRTVSPVIT